MKNINQKRGPTVGNAGNPEKRSTFTSEKSSVGSERAKVANMITDALAARGRDTRSSRMPGVEPLAPNVNMNKKKGK